MDRVYRILTSWTMAWIMLVMFAALTVYQVWRGNALPAAFNGFMFGFHLQTIAYKKIFPRTK